MSDVDDPGWHTYVTVRVGCGYTAECIALGPMALPVASSIIFILRTDNQFKWVDSENCMKLSTRREFLGTVPSTDLISVPVGCLPAACQ